MRSTQRPDTLAQDQYYSILTDFSCNAPPVHTLGSGSARRAQARSAIVWFARLAWRSCALHALARQSRSGRSWKAAAGPAEATFGVQIFALGRMFSRAITSPAGRLHPAPACRTGDRSRPLACTGPFRRSQRSRTCILAGFLFVDARGGIALVLKKYLPAVL